MKKNFINNTHIEGYVYEHKLEKKVSGDNSKNPGTEFINGTLSIATDDEMLNVVQVHFTYVTAVTSKGKANASYGVLENIIDGKIGSVMEHGKENAGKVRIDSALDLNEWYDTRTAGNPLVSVKRNEGGFIHITQELNAENQRATFEVDMVITGATRMDEDTERNQPEKVVVKGCIFNFRKALLPMEFTVLNPRAMDYFEGLGASTKTPVFTKLSGQQISKTVVKKIEEEGAFGEASVKEVRNTQRDFVITWAQATPYEWDSEDTILASELGEMIAAREVYLADVKKRQDEYQANKGGAFSTAPATSSPAKGEYKF